MTLDKIWKEYQSNIKAFLHSKISNPADVDDLLQEVLIKTHKNLHTLNSNESVKPWLFQITNNTITDFYRKRGKQQEVSIDGFEPIDEKDDSEHILARCVSPMINALPKEDAELLTLIDIGEQSQKEYAKEHDISYSTLKSRVQKSRKELKKLFTQCCDLSFDEQGNILDYEQKSHTCKKC